MKKCVVTAAMVLALSASAYATEKDVPAGYQLEKVVIVSRHGVRSPTKEKFPLAQISDQAWPEWSVGAGEMTPRGKALMTQMGHFYGQYFRQQKLLPAQGCPATQAVYIWADVDQRTRMTGQAFADGLAPGCNIAVNHQVDLKKDDPLFHPVSAGICPLDGQKVKQAFEQALGGTPDQLSQKYASELAQMSQVLNFSHSPWCQAHSDSQGRCDFATFQPNAVEVNKKGTKQKLTGPVGLSSTLAEIFLLQYAQGMPQAGWGRITSPEVWNALLTLHNAQFDLMSRTPYMAQHNGTVLMNQVYAALAAAMGDNVTSALPDATQSKILFLGAHDTNIANIAGMLGMNWTLPDQPDHTPPGGGLVFELWKDPASGGFWVKTQLFYQTLQQLRELQTLDINGNPARRITVKPGGCADGLCGWVDFSATVKKSLLQECL